jgi:hypothetical protein
MVAKKKQRDITDILPIVSIDEELGIGVLEDGSFMDVLRIRTKDYTYASEAEIEMGQRAFERLFKTYKGDLKITSAYFPVDVSKQQNYYRSLLERTRSPVFRDLIEDELAKQLYVNKHMKAKAYFLSFFFDKREKYKEVLQGIVSSLHMDGEPLALYMAMEEKRELFRLLCNKTEAI